MKKEKNLSKYKPDSSFSKGKATVTVLPSECQPCACDKQKDQNKKLALQLNWNATYCYKSIVDSNHMQKIILKRV